MVISHDRYLVERICDSTWALFGDGRLTNLPGGIEEYLRRRAAMGDGDVPSVASTVSKTGDAAEQPKKRDGAAERTARKELSRLERLVAKLTEKEEKLHHDLAEAATDPDRLQKLDAQLREVVAEKEAAEEQWMELAEDLD